MQMPLFLEHHTLPKVSRYLSQYIPGYLLLINPAINSHLLESEKRNKNNGRCQFRAGAGNPSVPSAIYLGGKCRPKTAAENIRFINDDELPSRSLLYAFQS